MTNAQKIATVKTLVESDPTATDDVVAVYLNLACNAMLERLFPYDPNKGEGDLPVRYEMTQCELAARMWFRRGGQAEISHEENGINRTWASADDDDILKRLTPFAKVGG